MAYLDVAEDGDIIRTAVLVYHSEGVRGAVVGIDGAVGDPQTIALPGIALDAVVDLGVEVDPSRRVASCYPRPTCDFLPQRPLFMHGESTVGGSVYNRHELLLQCSEEGKDEDKKG